MNHWAWGYYYNYSTVLLKDGHKSISLIECRDDTSWVYVPNTLVLIFINSVNVSVSVISSLLCWQNKGGTKPAFITTVIITEHHSTPSSPSSASQGPASSWPGANTTSVWRLWDRAGRVVTVVDDYKNYTYVFLSWACHSKHQLVTVATRINILNIASVVHLAGLIMAAGRVRCHIAAQSLC